MQIERDEQFSGGDFENALSTGGDLEFGAEESALMADPELLETPDELDESTAEAKPARTYNGRVSQTVGLQKTLDATQIYLNEIGFSPLLTPEEEVYFARLSMRGDAAGRKRMIESNLRLVVKIARRYINRGLSLLDLIEEGNLGLIRAVEKFDPERGFRFSTYDH
jgi:RNA polymerase nonessential primary-like sigma factor